MATTKQKIASKKLSENIRSGKSTKSLGTILKESGYSDSVSKSPQRVTESKGWKELLDKEFPDSALIKAHKALFKKKEIITYQGKFKSTRQPHSDVKFALELIYKLKGYLVNKNELSDFEIAEYRQFKEADEMYSDMSDEELEVKMKHLEKELRVSYIREAKSIAKD